MQQVRTCHEAVPPTQGQVLFTALSVNAAAAFSQRLHGCVADTTASCHRRLPHTGMLVFLL